MKKTKLTAMILSTIIILGIVTSTGVSAETTYNKISTMKSVSYEFNNDITKHEIGDINTLVYVDDTGRVYLTGNKDLLGNIDESKLDTLYYIDKNGKVVTVDNVNDIKYTNEKGYTYSTGDGPENKSSKVIESSSASTTSSDKLTNNATKTGWVSDNNGNVKYYYSNGDECFGWLKNGDNWYYLDRAGMVKNQRLKIDGKFYYFDPNGHLTDDINAIQIKDTNTTGWVKDRGYDSEVSWRYVYSSGQNCIGWLQDNGYWYYFDKCGHMLTDQMRKIDGKIYSFTVNGHLEVNTSRKTEYTENKFNHTGPTDGSGLLCASSPLNIDIDSNGVCTLTDNYYDNVNIILCRQIGHVTAGGSRHVELFDKNGDQVFGWYLEHTYTWNAESKDFSTTENWTYYDENGLEVIGTSKVIDGKSYSFDSNGYLM